MNKKAKTALWGLAIFSSIALLVLVSFVFAAHVIKTSSATTTFTINDDANTFLNISVNNTDADPENITEVIITLPASVNATDLPSATNNTDAGAHKFLNTNNITLNWSATGGGLIAGNGTIKYFWFNVTPTTPGKSGALNVTVLTVNNSDSTYNTTATTNLTLNVNDTFVGTFNSPTNGERANVSFLAPVNISFSGNETPVTMNVSFWNSTALIQSNFTTAVDSFVVNFTAEIASAILTDGNYYINISVNNTNSDSNVTNRMVTLDTIGPTPSLTQDSGSSTTSKIVVDIGVTEATSGVNGLCSVDNSLVTMTGSGTTSQTFTHSNLNCGTSVTYSVTCTDYAGNTGAAVEITASTDACSGGGSGSAGSSSSGGDNGGGGLSPPSDTEEEEESVGGVGAGDLGAGSARAGGLLSGGFIWLWTLIIVFVVIVIIYFIIKKNKQETMLAGSKK